MSDYENSQTDLSIKEDEEKKNALDIYGEKYRLLSENTTDVIWTLNFDFMITYVSPSVERVFGYGIEEIKKISLEKLIGREAFALLRKILAEELKNEKSNTRDLKRTRTFQLQQETAKGNLIWTEITTTFIRDENDNPTGILGVTKDITARKLTELQLQKNEKYLRTLINATNDSVGLLDINGEILLINEMGAKVFGKTVNEMIGRNAFEMYPIIFAKRKKQFDFNVLENGDPILYKADIGDRHLLIKIFLIDQEDGNRQLAFFGHDLTDQIKTEERLRLSQEHLEMRVEERTAELSRANQVLLMEIEYRDKAEEKLKLREAILSAIGFIAELFLKKRATDENICEGIERLGQAADVSGVAIYKNDRKFSINGFSHLKFAWSKSGNDPKKDISWIDTLSNKNMGTNAWGKELKKGKTIIAYANDTNGAYVNNLKKSHIHSLLAVPIFVQNKWWGLIAFGEKKTDRTWSSSELDAFKAATNIIGAAIGRNSYETELVESRRALDTLVGNLPGMAYRCDYNRKRTLEFVSVGCRELTEYSPSDLVFDKKISFSEVIHPDDQEMTWEKIQSAIEKQIGYQFIYRIYTAGGIRKWVWEQGCGVFDEKGEVIALEGFVLDISQQRNLEIQLKENAKEIELFNDILAHDIGNINQTVLANLSMLLSEDFGPLTDDQKSLLFTFERQIRRTLSLIQKVKTVSQVRGAGTETFVRTDINAAIRVAREALISGTKNKIVKINYAPGNDRKVIADHLIVQLFLNLFENAVNHVREDFVRIDVSVNSTFHDEKDCWKISVCDNGQGIRDELKKIIFDRFEKGQKRKGSGIGLAIVKALTLKYNGHIYVEDKVAGDQSGGACFQIILPKA